MDTQYTELNYANSSAREHRLGGLPALAPAGMPEPLPTYGSAGDAGEGSLLPVHLRQTVDLDNHLLDEPRALPLVNDLAVNHDSGFTPLPGILPGQRHLDYTRQLTTTTLLTVAIVFLVYRAITSPGSTAKLLAGAATKHAGVG